MYVSAPLFLAVHLVGLTLLGQWILTPLFGLPRTPSGIYIVIDRHKIRGLSLLDKFNCAFCDYANGLCVLFNTKLDHLNAFAGESGVVKKSLLLVLVIPLMPVLMVIQFLGIHVIYDVLVSRPLGMRRRSVGATRRHLASIGYAASWGRLGRIALRHEKNFALRLSSALEQVESAWCPLIHLCK